MRRSLLALSQTANTQGQIRIIGGQWRGRKLTVRKVSDLRPTPNRVRETIFNWLQVTIPGARCLDLFAGSGALGFEALSREAKEVVMIEHDPEIFQQLQENQLKLQAHDAELISADAIEWLSQSHKPFDIIFLDPPFHRGLLQDCLCLIEENDIMNDDGLIYIECETELGLPEMLTIHKQKEAGQVQYGLYHINT